MKALKGQLTAANASASDQSKKLSQAEQKARLLQIDLETAKKAADAAAQKLTAKLTAAGKEQTDALAKESAKASAAAAASAKTHAAEVAALKSAAAEDAPVRAEELIDISMDSPVGDEEDTRWYRCDSVAAFNATLEFSATTPIGGKVMPGAVIEALEHADTRAGKRRVRSHKGWFSLVSTNGTRCASSQPPCSCLGSSAGPLRTVPR